MTRLQNPVKASFNAINDSLKETHGSLNKYTKSLDKVLTYKALSACLIQSNPISSLPYILTTATLQLFKDRPLPSTEHDVLSEQEHLINRAIAMHLLREGQFSVAATFLSEIAEKKDKMHNPASPSSSASPEPSISLLNLDEVPSPEIRKEFASMYYILSQLKERKNLLPAIEWSRENREALEARGSNLEFELCRLQFVWLYHGESDMVGGNHVPGNWRAAMAYAKREFHTFLPRYIREVQQLMGAMAFCPNLHGSPYSAIFNNTSAWDDVAQFFTREFCSLLGLSADSPLYIAATAGAIALPTLLKLQTIMKAKRTEWTSENELPVGPTDRSGPKQTKAIELMCVSCRLKFHFRPHTSSIRSLFAPYLRSKLLTRTRP